MAIVLETSRSIKNFPNTELAHFINIPIQIGIGAGELKPKPEYARYIDVDYKPWRVIEEFRRIEQELLYPETVGKKVLELHKKSIEELWEGKRDSIWKGKRDSVFWSWHFDGHSYQFKNIDEDGDEDIESCGHFVERASVHERNDTIFKIRCKFLREYKTGRGNYENLGTYFYKSHYHKELFLEIIQALGLAKKAAPKKSTVEIKALEGGFNPYALTSKENGVSSNLYQEDEL